MTVECLAPDVETGVALRLATYLDCQSRALGENGFQAVAGGPAMAGILSGLITIFVALIGYRMILGAVPSLRDGVGWALRLGIVLALVTSWPAFQTVIYRVVTDGPPELGNLVMPATGVASDNMDERVQGVYDRIRLGSSGEALQADTANPQQPVPGALGQTASPRVAPGTLGIPPLPGTASLFVVSTAGVTAALRIIVGFLVAIGPLAILCLLFQGTTGVFDGWMRAVVGAAFGVLAATITSALELVVIESELAHEQAVQFSEAAGSYDSQALVTIVSVFLAVALGSIFAGVRVASGFRLPMASVTGGWSMREATVLPSTSTAGGGYVRSPASPAARTAVARDRAAAVAGALSAAAYRDHTIASAEIRPSDTSRQMTIRQESGRITAIQPVPLGVAGRRSSGRRSRSARRRDMPA